MPSLCNRAADPGDDWAVDAHGNRYWGRYGAAGLLVHDPGRGILLQHRADWNHFGGTWAPPGGAKHRGESATDGAFREAWEEARIPRGAVRPRFHSVLDMQVWSYTTIVADADASLAPAVNDAESIALAWVPPDRVADYPLHPAFASSWPRLSRLLPVRPLIVVDAPSGRRIDAAVRVLREHGVAAAHLGLPEDRWYPEVTVATSRPARRDASARPAAGAGPAASIPALATVRDAAGRRVAVVTDDPVTAARCRAAGADAYPTAWLYTATGV